MIHYHYGSCIRCYGVNNFLLTKGIYKKTETAARIIVKKKKLYAYDLLGSTSNAYPNTIFAVQNC